jgi:hypothetical protein
MLKLWKKIFYKMPVGTKPAQCVTAGSGKIIVFDWTEQAHERISR